MAGPLGRTASTARGMTTAAVGPHGYTLTIWASTVETIRRHGLPGYGSALAFLVAASLGFAAVHHASAVRARAEEAWPVAPGFAAVQAPAMIAATLVAWLASAALPSWAAWPAVAFAATAVYWTAAAALVAVRQHVSAAPDGAGPP